MRKLTLADIVDMRAYERERDDFRRHIIDLKRIRRVAIGPIMTIVFENTETMRWQVQEMARVERMLRDEQIQHEVDTYNEIIPDAGQLSGTLLLELTSEAQLREWLPRLVGIELEIGLAFPDGSVVLGKPSDADEQRLTRPDTTAAVHFLRFELSPTQVAEFETGPVKLVSLHHEYPQEVVLEPATRLSLAADLRDVT